MFKSAKWYFLWIFFALGSCSDIQKPKDVFSTNIKIKNHYAEFYQLSVSSSKKDTFLSILDLFKKPIITYYWGKSNQYSNAQKITAKNKKIVLSVLFARMLQELNETNSIVGIDHRAYFPSDISLPASTVSLQESGILNTEAFIKLNADLSFAYFLNNQDFQKLNRFNTGKHSIIFIQSHQEKHPLARAEWIRPMAWILGKSYWGDSLFNQVKTKYGWLKKSVKTNQQKVKRVMLNLPFQGSWYVPNHEAYFTQLLIDAGLRPAWEFNRQYASNESILISLEQAIQYLKQSDLWLNVGNAKNKAEISAFESRLEVFCQQSNITIYQFDKKLESNGANPFWDLGSIHPELILEDLIHISNQDDSLNFYRKI